MSAYLEDFEISYTGFIPEYDSHCHVCSRNYELQYIETGNVILEYNGQHHELGGGSIWINHPGVRYEYRPDPETGWWRHRFIVFNGGICEHWKNYSLLPFEPLTGNPVPEAAARLDRIMECARYTAQPLYRLEAANLLENFLIDLVRHDQPLRPDWLPPALGELEKSNQPDYRRIAAAAGMSLRSFLRKFQAATGFSPHQYHMNHRIKCATRYLETTTLGLKEIASELGFSDAAHLVRQYRKATGAPPGALRNPPKVSTKYK